MMAVISPYKFQHNACVFALLALLARCINGQVPTSYPTSLLDEEEEAALAGGVVIVI
jgi:hypothetical protein